ncbi:MAG: hypothetical protein WCL18_10105 [bacterium]
MSFLQNDSTLQNNITNVVSEFKQKRIVVDLSSEATGLDSWFKSIEYPYPSSTNASRKNILPTQNSVS